VGTYENQQAASEGRFRVQLVAEGWPEIFVTDSNMVWRRPTDYLDLSAWSDIGTPTKTSGQQGADALDFTGYLLEDNAGGNGEGISGTGFSMAPSTPQTVEFWVERDAAATVFPHILLRERDSGASIVATHAFGVDQSTGDTAIAVGSPSLSTTLVNGFYRVAVEFTSTGTTATFDFLYYCAAQTTLGTYDPTAMGTSKLWGVRILRGADQGAPPMPADGRERVLGLDPQTIRFTAQADLMRAQLRAQEMPVEIVDDDDRTITASLGQSPSATTYLQADLAEGHTTSMTVSSTAGFPGEGVVHVGTEAIHYTDKTATTFTGLTRGYWDSQDQAHFTRDGDRSSYPRVTDRPRTLRGRRCHFYLYGQADALAAAPSDDEDPHRRWQGIANTDRSHRKSRWSFAVRPITYLLEQMVGGDIEEPVPISGIYLPANSALRIKLYRYSTAGFDSSATTSDTVDIALSGRWVDNEALCADITAELATATSGWSWAAGSSLVAESLGSQGWRLVYRTGSTATYVALRHSIPRAGGSVGVSPVDIIEGGRWLDSSGAETVSLDPNASYSIAFRAPVPRGVIGTNYDVVEHTFFSDPDSPDNTPDRIYLGGTVVPSAAMFVAVRPDGEEGDDEVMATVRSVDTTNRYVAVRPVPYATLGPRTRIRLARTLKSGGFVHQLIEQLETDSPGLANTGAMPLLVAGDFDGDWDDVRNAIADLRIASRTWVTAEGITLGEIIEHELRLIGCYLAMDSIAQMTIKRLSLALETDPTAITITDSKQSREPPGTDFNAHGHVSEVVVRQGWDPVEREHKGMSIRVRNEETVDPTVLGGVLEVAPRSLGLEVADFGIEVDPEDAYTLAQGVFGIFSGGYRIVTLEANLSLLDVQLGDALLVTSSEIPNTDGTKGVTNAVALLIGHDWSPFEGKGSLTLLMHDRRIAGYAPSFKVASASGSGTSWTLTLTLTNYTDQTNVSTWLAAGDEIRLVEYDTTGPTIQAGVVASITDPNQVEVTLDASWGGLGGAEYTLEYDVSSAVDTVAPSGRRWAQKAFAFIADSTGRLTLSTGDVDAFDFL